MTQSRTQVFPRFVGGFHSVVSFSHACVVSHCLFELPTMTEEAAEAAAVPPWIGPANDEQKTSDQVSSVWEFSKVLVLENQNKWQCLWCQKISVMNATKARYHLAKEPGNGIAICSGAMHPDALVEYRKFSSKNDQIPAQGGAAIGGPPSRRRYKSDAARAFPGPK